MGKAKDLNMLSLCIKACKKCPLVCTRESPTIYRGNINSALMLVGDFPRQSDHKSGKSFGGRSGKKIDSLLTKADINPENVYYTSLIKCFAGREGIIPENAPAKCYGWLAAQIKIINPLLVILCGPEALEWVLFRGTGESSETLLDWVGPTIRRRDVYGELRFMILPHPLSLSKELNKDLENKCITALKTAKEFIVARQTNQITPHIEVIDLKKKIIHSRKDQTEGIKWTKPVSE